MGMAVLGWRNRGIGFPVYGPIPVVSSSDGSLYKSETWIRLETRGGGAIPCRANANSDPITTNLARPPSQGAGCHCYGFRDYCFIVYILFRKNYKKDTWLNESDSPEFRPLKIVIPLLGFGRAGGFRVLSELATHWQRFGHEIVFLVDATEGNTTPYFPTEAKIDIVETSGIKLTKGALQKIERVLRGTWGLAYALSSAYKDWDIILASRDLTAYPVRFCRSVARKYYYIQAYEPDFYDHRYSSLVSRIFDAGLQWASRLSYKLQLERIVNSPLYLRYREVEASSWVPPGINPHIFYPARECRSTSKNFIIGCIGRKEAIKGASILIEGYRLAHRQDPSLRLRIAFNRPSSDLWDPECMEVVEPKGDRDLADFYRGCDAIVAFGAHQHGAFHYPTLEALACGVPLISSPYLPANQSNAWIIENSTVEGVAEAILGCSRASKDLVSSRIQAGLDCVGEFEWDKVANRMINIFRNHSVS